MPGLHLPMFCVDLAISQIFDKFDACQAALGIPQSAGRQ